MIPPFAFFESLGFGEILVILAVFLLFFGSSKLPKLARSLGSSMTEFKKGLRGEPAPDSEAKKLDEKSEEKAKTGE
ncbi:MAG TPA: twin-arginine translocase TatA/TatE family subunit [Planctomycetota bacterium]|nr:twin-arginine translocase TatA/TatE family subunit [Planctomycetota bacterium]